uniref:Uncharacterized protein n=1 Tax=Tetranychus urticae TaxID=32264 RepID=T1L4I9_TETUR
MVSISGDEDQHILTLTILHLFVSFTFIISLNFPLWLIELKEHLKGSRESDEHMIEQIHVASCFFKNSGYVYSGSSMAFSLLLWPNTIEETKSCLTLINKMD